MNKPEACTIEIVERTNDPDPLAILPNEIRINGRPVLAPNDEPVEVHGISVSGEDVVKVTLTLYAKRVTIAAEPKN